MRAPRLAPPGGLGEAAFEELEVPSVPLRARLTSTRIAAGAGLLILAASACLLVYGLSQPAKWSTQTYAGGVLPGTDHVLQPPFPTFTRLRLFDAKVHPQGEHLYLLGSDAGGHDLLELAAQGAVPSLLLVAIVVVARLATGVVAGLSMALGAGWVRALARAAGGWAAGFPYLALAIVVIQGLTPHSRPIAFVVGMALVGWRDIAEIVAERCEHVLGQLYATAARSLGTQGWRFFQLHLWPHLRPALAVEVPFQAGAVLVLLAELGYLQVFLGSVIQLQDTGVGGGAIAVNQFVTRPELGQLLANARISILYHQLGPVLVPALAITVLALGFELLGSAARGRTRVSW
jgi:ABC-type dipeptide/oligopeptide/nickel transport system permease subunit